MKSDQVADLLQQRLSRKGLAPDKVLYGVSDVNGQVDVPLGGHFEVPTPSLSFQVVGAVMCSSRWCRASRIR